MDERDTDIQLQEKMLQMHAAKLAAGQELFGKSCHPDDYKDFISALKAKPRKRSNDQAFLIKLILGQLELFQSVPIANMDHICKHVKYKKFEESSLIVETGDHAKECFMLISGIVDVEIKVPDKNDTSQFNTAVVFNFKSGDFFGDYGFQQRNARRTADCRAKTKCHVLRIPKFIYCDYMLQYMYNNRDLKKEFFLKKIALPIYPRKFLDVVLDPTNEKFAQYDQTLTEHMNWMKCKSFTKGDVIGLQGHGSRSLYFVVQGSVRCLKTIFANGKPVILQLGLYQHGQSFGAQFSQIEETNIHTWVANSAVTVYTIAKSDFQKLFHSNCVQLYSKNTNQLEVSEASLRKTIKQQTDWACYRNKLIEEITDGCDVINVLPSMKLPKHVANDELAIIQRVSARRTEALRPNFS